MVSSYGYNLRSLKFTIVEKLSTLILKNKIKDVRMAKIISPKMLSGENTPIQKAMVTWGWSAEVPWGSVADPDPKDSHHFAGSGLWTIGYRPFISY